MTGCGSLSTSATPPTSVATADPDDAFDQFSTTAEPIWQVSATAVSDQPVLVNDVVITYVSTPTDPFVLAAFNASDGTPLWQRVASTGASAEFDLARPVTVVSDANDAPLIATITPPELQADGKFAHTVVALDPRSGAVVAESPRLWTHLIHPCDNAPGVCFSAMPSRASSYSEFRLDPENGATSDNAESIAGTEVFTHLVKDVYAVRRGNAETLVRVVEGTTVWKLTPKQLSENVTVSPVSGVSIATVSTDGDVLLASMSVEMPAVSDDGTPVTIPTNKLLTVAIELATGEVLWRKDGATQCMGTSGLLCTGAVSFEKDGASGISIKTGATTISSIEPRTGATEWDHAFTTLDTKIGSRAHGGMVAPTGFALVADKGAAQLVNLRSGTVRPPKAGDMIACFSPSSFTAFRASHPGRELVTYSAGRLAQGCVQNGSAATNPSSLSEAVVIAASREWRAVSELNSTDSNPRGLRIIQTSSGLAAFEIPWP